ncbi:relaxin-3 receptor 2 [Bombina bombina]|uniref:relaxin-3 receptor 2 n=1 Tax=Bombina bombina TaxID=8345 RepID=UPI00235A488B|nr:relaxin-3 receptor 2 [Bombina bombina]
MTLNYSLSSTESSAWNASQDDAFEGIGGIDLDDGATIPTYGLPSYRILISTVYSLVCAMALLGNITVMYLIRAKRSTGLSAIDVFVFCLAITDIQFTLTLPFWAADAVLDFSWPFGHLMCKIVLTITVLNFYSTIFLLSAMAITRYWSVASALRPRCRVSSSVAKWISLALWIFAVLATIPTTIFATTSKIMKDELCILKFPTNKWLATYHLQKLIIGFIIPLVMITSSYCMLLKFLKQHNVNANNHQRQSKITNSIQLVITVFFVCWFPNLAAIFWGILIKFEVVQWSVAHYYFHTYVFPITICLAHSNSCLNPIIYCLMRKEFRKALKATFWKISTLLASYWPSSPRKGQDTNQETTMPLYRTTSFNRTGSKDYAVASQTTLTVLQDFNIKEQPNTEHREQDTLIKSIPH